MGTPWPNRNPYLGTDFLNLFSMKNAVWEHPGPTGIPTDFLNLFSMKNALYFSLFSMGLPNIPVRDNPCSMALFIRASSSRSFVASLALSSLKKD